MTEKDLLLFFYDLERLRFVMNLWFLRGRDIKIVGNRRIICFNGKFIDVLNIFDKIQFIIQAFAIFFN